MDSFDIASLHALTDEQAERLAAVIVDEFGGRLTRRQFNGIVLALFEDIAGFETLSRKRATRHVNAIWRVYQRFSRFGLAH